MQRLVPRVDVGTDGCGHFQSGMALAAFRQEDLGARRGMAKHDIQIDRHVADSKEVGVQVGEERGR